MQEHLVRVNHARELATIMRAVEDIVYPLPPDIVPMEECVARTGNVFLSNVHLLVQRVVQFGATQMGDALSCCVVKRRIVVLPDTEIVTKTVKDV